MLKTLVFSSIFALCLVSNLNGFIWDKSWEMIHDDWIPNMQFPNLGNPEQKIGAMTCDSVSFQNAQYQFDKALNLSTDLTWKNSESLFVKLRSLMRKGGVKEFQQVCQARDAFQRNLGASYFPCMNRYFLMNQGGATWRIVMTYLHLFEHLDFMCNQGFEQLSTQATWNCIGAVESLNKTITQLQNCDNQFNQTLNNNYNNLALLGYTSCYWDVYNKACFTPIGYYACEDIRVGYARDCRNIRCLVNSDDTHNYGQK